MGFLLFGNILTPDRPLASRVTGEVPRPKMVLGLTVVPSVLPLRVMVLAPALVLSVNLKLCVL